jgi:hypothetical protein
MQVGPRVPAGMRLCGYERLELAQRPRSPYVSPCAPARMTRREDFLCLRASLFLFKRGVVWGVVCTTV